MLVDILNYFVCRKKFGRSSSKRRPKTKQKTESYENFFDNYRDSRSKSFSNFSTGRLSTDVAYCTMDDFRKMSGLDQATDTKENKDQMSRLEVPTVAYSRATADEERSDVVEMKWLNKEL